MGFGLDISSERRHTNVEPLNDLPKEEKKQQSIRPYNSFCATFSIRTVFISKIFSSTAGTWHVSSGFGRFKDIERLREKCDLGEVENESHFFVLYTPMIQNVNFPWLNKELQ